MPATEPAKFAELDAQADALRYQLEGKSSLFDVLSPPPGSPPDAATKQDNKLNWQIRCGLIASYLLIFVCFASRFFGSRASLTPLLYAAFFAVGTFTGIKLLRERVIALESEIERLRAKLHTATPNDRKA